MRNLKKDKTTNAKIILPANLKNKYSKSRYDFVGIDTKTGTNPKISKIKKGVRGGTFVIKNGKKHYLRKN